MLFSYTMKLTYVLFCILINVITCMVDRCPFGLFKLPGMSACHKWLSCEDLYVLHFKELIGLGAVKSVYRAEWKSYNISASFLNSPIYESDFKHNLNMLKLLSSSPYVVQLVGFCETENVLFTEYHRLGDATKMLKILNSKEKHESDIKIRLRLCLNYAMLLTELHHGPAGTRVMCDSNDLQKLLSQLLITDSFELILNDLDALPEVNKKLNKTVKCGNREIKGDFVAPEQLWNFPEPFNDSMMPGYGEETDIWKVPSVCSHFLDNFVDNGLVYLKLLSIHLKCKNRDPENRPKSRDLVKLYSEILNELNHDEF